MTRGQIIVVTILIVIFLRILYDLLLEPTVNSVICQNCKKRFYYSFYTRHIAAQILEHKENYLDLFCFNCNKNLTTEMSSTRWVKKLIIKRNIKEQHMVFAREYNKALEAPNNL